MCAEECNSGVARSIVNHQDEVLVAIYGRYLILSPYINVGQLTRGDAVGFGCRCVDLKSFD